MHLENEKRSVAIRVQSDFEIDIWKILEKSGKSEIRLILTIPQMLVTFMVHGKILLMSSKPVVPNPRSADQYRIANCSSFFTNLLNSKIMNYFYYFPHSKIIKNILK